MDPMSKKFRQQVSRAFDERRKSLGSSQKVRPGIIFKVQITSNLISSKGFNATCHNYDESWQRFFDNNKIKLHPTKHIIKSTKNNTTFFPADKIRSFFKEFKGTRDRSSLVVKVMDNTKKIKPPTPTIDSSTNRTFTSTQQRDSRQAHRDRPSTSNHHQNRTQHPTPGRSSGEPNSMGQNEDDMNLGESASQMGGTQYVPMDDDMLSQVSQDSQDFSLDEIKKDVITRFNKYFTNTDYHNILKEFKKVKQRPEKDMKLSRLMPFTGKALDIVFGPYLHLG